MAVKKQTYQIGAASLTEEVKLLVPITYKLGDDEHRESIELRIHISHPDFAVLDRLYTKPIVNTTFITLSEDLLEEMPVLKAEIEKRVEECVKKHYRESVS